MAKINEEQITITISTLIADSDELRKNVNKELITTLQSVTEELIADGAIVEISEGAIVEISTGDD